jgi:HD-GYP domain-containing protein (c-di-GMP phosphodiesterase class II)
MRKVPMGCPSFYSTAKHNKIKPFSGGILAHFTDSIYYIRRKKPGRPVTEKTAIEMLKDISFFSNMSDYDLRQIAEIVTEKSYRKGAAIIEELTEAERFFIIHKGKIEITKKFEGYEEFVLAVQSDGDFFGEMALLDEGRRSATVRALEPTTVLEISRNNFETLLYKAPVLAYRILKELSSRLRETGALLISYLKQRNRQLYQAYIDTMTMVVHAMEKRNGGLRGLSRRVTELAKAIGKEMGLAEEDQLILELGALLHDLGMLSMPDKIVEKPGRLTEAEFEKIKLHAKKSTEIISGIPFLEKVIPQILYHHEKFDGTGYPDGLRGPDIPQASRIIAVVDAFSSMTRTQPYREKLTADQAVEEIRKGASKEFDPAVVDVFLKLWESGKVPAGE